jgi:hypothetical protein
VYKVLLLPSSLASALLLLRPFHPLSPHCLVAHPSSLPLLLSFSLVPISSLSVCVCCVVSTSFTNFLTSYFLFVVCCYCILTSFFLVVLWPAVF